MADGISEFPPVTIIEQPSWAGLSFALVDGTPISPKWQIPPPVAFETDPTKCRVGGTFDEWQSELLLPLAGQSIPISLFGFALAAPLLELTGRSENFGLEIVGEPRCGKSTCQFLVASMMGATKNDGSGKYWISGDATLDGLESQMAQHAGMPMIINEANLLYADMAPRVRGDKLKALAFRFAQGQEKARFQSGKPRTFRFIYIMSSNVPISALTSGQETAVTDATLDRLMTLRIQADRPHGVFDFVPDGFADARAYANALERISHQHYGHAMRRFLAALVKDRASNPDKLLRRIDKLMARFRSRVAPGDRPYNPRVMDAFALAYAAGELARRYAVFPPKIYFGDSLAKTYAMAVDYRAQDRSIDERLKSLSRLPGVIDLDHSKLVAMDDATFRAVPAFLRTNRNGQRETLLRREMLDQQIPGWSKLLRGESVATVHVRDADRLTVKRDVRKGCSDRMVVLRIPSQ